MKSVCYIHSYPKATDTLKLLWPGFKLLGLPLIGVETIDGEHFWPEPIPTITIGVNKHWLTDRRYLPTRLVNTLGHFLSTDYERCCIVEYDTLITGPLPEYPPGLVTHRAGGQLPNTRATQFFHTPWYCDRPAASKIIMHGSTLIAQGECDEGNNGSPDVFLGLIVDDLKLPWRESGTFSANTIEGVFIEAARKAYREGCTFFHGCKKQEHVDSIIK